MNIVKSTNVTFNQDLRKQKMCGLSFPHLSPVPSLFYCKTKQSMAFLCPSFTVSEYSFSLLLLTFFTSLTLLSQCSYIHNGDFERFESQTNPVWGQSNPIEDQLGLLPGILFKYQNPLAWQDNHLELLIQGITVCFLILIVGSSKAQVQDNFQIIVLPPRYGIK